MSRKGQVREKATQDPIWAERHFALLGVMDMSRVRNDALCVDCRSAPPAGHHALSTQRRTVHCCDLEVQH